MQIGTRARAFGRAALAAALAAAPFAGAARADGGPPPADRVAERIDRARGAREGWQEIPWRTDLGEARRASRESGRPIFLWAMNGNPLGCT